MSTTTTSRQAATATPRTVLPTRTGTRPAVPARRKFQVSRQTLLTSIGAAVSAPVGQIRHQSGIAQ